MYTKTSCISFYKQIQLLFNNIKSPWCRCE